MSNYFLPDQLHYHENIEHNPQFASLRGIPEGFAAVPSGEWYGVDPIASDLPPSHSTKTRTRIHLGHEHVKHRRTRSGCYKCRERRVKCDEARPVCERCKKGSRECVYPEPRPNVKYSTKLGQARTAAHDIVSSSEDDDEDEEQEAEQKMAGKSQTAKRSAKTSLKARRRSRTISETTNRRLSVQSPTHAIASIEQGRDVKEMSLSPQTDDSSVPSASRSMSDGPQQPRKFSSASTATSQDTSSWSNLPTDVQNHLDYHQTLTHYHYFFKHDATEFIRVCLVEYALNFDPLLYAIVGFAAFHRTLQSPNGKIQDFLGYYNKSVTLLRRSLFEGHHPTHATLLTILQLATFEEYLGDWVNLLGHQKAAYGILTDLFTPATILETESRRRTLEWYQRFDMRTGFMAGHELVLGREWFCASSDYYRHQAFEHPESINLKMESATASHRLLAMDMAMLFAKLRRGEVTVQDFLSENATISQRLTSLVDHLGPLLSDSKYLVTNFEGAKARDPEDIVDPYKPGGLHQGELFSANFMRMDWISLEMMHKNQTSEVLQQEPPSDLPLLALEVCRLFEAIEYWPQSPPGAVLAAQATLGIATIFLPKDGRHTMWCRRKLAKMESLGYIYPRRFRSNLAEVWDEPEILHWWLPNNESYPAIIGEIRAFIKDRSSQPHPQTETEDLREMKAIFSSMSVQNGLDESQAKARRGCFGIFRAEPRLSHVPRQV